MSCYWGGAQANASTVFTYTGTFTDVDAISHMFDDWVVGGEVEVELTFSDYGDFEKLYIYSAGTGNGLFSTDNAVVTGLSPFDTSWEDVDYYLNFYSGYMSYHLISGRLDGYHKNGYEFTAEINNPSGNTVPIPGAVWLLGSGLIGFAGLRRKRVKA